MTIRTLLEYRILVRKYSSNETLGVIDFDVDFFKNKPTWYRISKPNIKYQNNLGKYRLLVMNMYGSIRSEIIK